MINDINKLSRDAVKAMYFIEFILSLLLITIESITIIGIKIKNGNNMY